MMIVADDRPADGNELANIPSGTVSSSKTGERKMSGKDVGGHRRDFPLGITDRVAKSGVTDRETNQPRPCCADLAGFEDAVRGADLRSAPSPLYLSWNDGPRSNRRGIFAFPIIL